MLPYWRLAALIFTALALDACAGEPLRNASFFPEGAFSSSYAGAKFSQDLYGRALKSLDEPSILDVAPETNTYRFLWLRSFHRPVSVRLVELPNGRARAHYKMSDVARGDKPGRLIVNKSLTISAVKFDAIKALFADAMICEPFVSDIIGVDGAQWIFEHNINGDYCVADEWGGHRTGFQELGLAMLDVVGWHETNTDPIY